MNGAGTSKRRSARLSAEGADENGPPAKISKVNGTETTAVSTKEQDGNSGAAAKRKRQGENLSGGRAQLMARRMWRAANELA